jgi:hypothetical protein
MNVLSGWYYAMSIEPQLFNLECHVSATHLDMDDPEFWPTWSRFKAELARLVGWDCKRPELQKSRYYEMAFDHLWCIYSGGRG